MIRMRTLSRSIPAPIILLLLFLVSYKSAPQVLTFSTTTIFTPQPSTLVLAMSTTSGDTLKQKVAIIGATGRLGSEVVKNLSSKGIPMRCLIRSGVPPELLASLPKVEFVKGEHLDRSCFVVIALDRPRSWNRTFLIILFRILV